MKYFVISCLVIMILALITSCSDHTVTEAMPGIDIPLAEYNTKVVLELYPGTSNSVTNGDSPTFVLKNQTGNSITFPNDFGIRIFEKQPQGWIPVENRFGYPDEDFILPPSAASPGGLVVDAEPFIPNSKDQAIIRIVVIGHVQDRPDEKVGAYIDMELNP